MITSWSSKKQATVSLSSTEGEYIATSGSVEEAMFIQSLIKELTEELRPAVIYVRNLRAIFLSKNQQLSARTKHIDVRRHFTGNLL
jgi:DNA-binding transcriptional regulator YdaS (Cro superfamily)